MPAERPGPEPVEAREDPTEYLEAGLLAPEVELARALVRTGAFGAERHEAGQNVTQGHQFEGSFHGDSVYLRATAAAMLLATAVRARHRDHLRPFSLIGSK